ncbi:MAG TPA: hypothetical protein VFH06_03695 [Candidatus Saccharimonadales bacterium]|nr:hypothetical protein [Candidatus Saccharimonadales bacterium]
MYWPNEDELRQAAELDIDATGLNGIQLREAITRAKLRAQQKNRPATGGGLHQYKALADVARSLGMIVEKGTTLTDLRHEVELQIGEMLYDKKIEPGVMVVYGKGSRDHAGTQARVVKTNVTWTMNMPHIVLHHENADRAHPYYAHIVALYATVVE